MVCDIGLAEELAQDALVAALEQCESPAFRTIPAWLMAAAKHRAIDVFLLQQSRTQA